MKPLLSFFSLLLFYNCNVPTEPALSVAGATDDVKRDPVLQISGYPEGSFKHFLQNLPYTSAPVVDYKGNKVQNQEKSWGVLGFDVGSRDLQQCADALMRIRAEYLFAKGKHAEISFRFTSGHAFSFSDYCAGMRPYFQVKKLGFRKSAQQCSPVHAALRKYLDIIYTYAGTISLEKELSRSDLLEVGSVIIKGGSPGHCMMIINHAKDADGNDLFMLAEGYTPAQSIYILNNLGEPELGPWHRLDAGRPVSTASYYFASYSVRKFE